MARMIARRAAATPEEGEAQAQELVRRLKLLAVTDDPRTVRRVVARLFGEERVVDTMGAGSREERTQRLRSYRFHASIPWLAQVWMRPKNGRARASWLLIDRVTDEVVAMDPNPWDDVEESRTLPIVDFHVLWELTGCASIAIG